uniref:Dolichyl-diphosphooligosaccharide--protein glycosyltransferase subunit DAD1 n=1 Tax=Sinocyclocheilus grahami TaxID=75366 RepID=A0A672LJG0_SINGR
MSNNSVISVISRFLEEYASSITFFIAFNNISIMSSLVCLRIQIHPQNKGEFLSISPERAFADFLFAHTVLHSVIINFIG